MTDDMMAGMTNGVIDVIIDDTIKATNAKIGALRAPNFFIVGLSLIHI